VLERSGLVTRRKRGSAYVCRLHAAPLREAMSWFARHQQFWTERLDALGEFLEEPNDEG